MKSERGGEGGGKGQREVCGESGNRLRNRRVRGKRGGGKRGRWAEGATELGEGGGEKEREGQVDARW